MSATTVKSRKVATPRKAATVKSKPTPPTSKTAPRKVAAKKTTTASPRKAVVNRRAPIRVMECFITNPDKSGFCTVYPRYNVKTDRRDTFGIEMKESMVERFLEAVWSDKVFVDCEVRTDDAGQTFVSESCTVRAKRLNADLTRLGF